MCEVRVQDMNPAALRSKNVDAAVTRPRHHGCWRRSEWYGSGQAKAKEIDDRNRLLSCCGNERITLIARPFLAAATRKYGGATHGQPLAAGHGFTFAII